MSALPDLRGYWADLTRAERGVIVFMTLVVVYLLGSMLTGGLDPTYFLFLFGLGGMFALMSLGLNAQWGFTGLINFSVAAFFGLGAYGAAIMTASNSPVAGGFNPIFGLLLGLVLAAVIAVAIGIPTLRLQADYLAIASLGLAEVVRLVILNEDQWTAGSQGLRGIPRFFEGWPVVEDLPETLPTITFELLPGEEVTLATSFWQQLLNASLVLVFLGASFLVLRRAHRSPWGRVLRTIRSDEDLAKALGKNTYFFKMQAFVLGCLVMALGGVFFAHLNLFVNPGSLDPTITFYVWVAVILGGAGSNRGALFGGFVVVAIREGPRFVSQFPPSAIGQFVDDIAPAVISNNISIQIPSIAVDPGPLRLLLIGLVIILVMRFRPEGVLPPQRELIWPGTVDSAVRDQPETGVREARGGDSDE
jgi:ABC-type branched-subunit amino acid transport system permease subunit